jgi:hypothetical protein
MKTIVKTTLALVLLLGPTLLWAHAGHGHDNPLSPGHYVTNPEHSVQLVLIVSASVAFAWLINRSIKKLTEEK